MKSVSKCVVLDTLLYSANNSISTKSGFRPFWKWTLHVLINLHHFTIKWVSFIILEKVYFRSQILEHPSIGEYWNISGVPVLPENVILMSFSTCWCYSEAYNTGTQKWSSIVQYSCTSICDLKYTFSGPSKQGNLQWTIVLLHRGTEHWTSLFF